MMQRFLIKPRRTGQEGQTLVLVAISLFALIAMAALAIDLTTLYVARGEMQHAADAAALAGAKAFVDSGVTTSNVNDPNYANLQGLATNIGTQTINALLAQNKVGGVPPLLVGSPAFDFTTHPGNPQVTVTLQRTDVPTFFARIFGPRLVTVGASATAEAYNPSEPPGGTTGMPPVAPSCVKPWLIPNADPHNTPDPFIDEDTGEIKHPGIAPAGVIGEEILLKDPCIGLCGSLGVPLTATAPNLLAYLPAQLTAASNGSCPSCAGGSEYEQSSSCCDAGSPTEYACGNTGPGLAFNLVGGLIGNTISSVECLIGASGAGPAAGQDEIGLGTSAQGPANTFGNFLDSNGNDPIEIRAGNGPHAGQLVTTSPSIVTLPIYGVKGLSGVLSLVTVHIVGYMQAFVEQSPSGGNGEIEIYVLNISGCGPNVNPALTPISGGGASPVPVRLIHQ